VVDLLNLGFELMMRVLLWVVALVPLAVFGVVASSVGQKEGVHVFESLIWLILVVISGLACQVIWYLVLMAVFARMSPVRFILGASDVMASTFSTASTAATIPITLRALRKLGVSRESSQLAACIGTNFNNDGTALYQATAVLFMAQALNFGLSPTNQLIVVLTTLVASVGAGGIPSGSFVTLPLIFAAVGLPADKIPVLLTIDWFLDRCRTTSNVLGDMTVAVLLDRTASATARALDVEREDADVLSA
jgi:DAACS family dicarboxylate/amino acid:cation (Na+ or H+) symporter